MRPRQSTRLYVYHQFPNLAAPSILIACVTRGIKADMTTQRDGDRSLFSYIPVFHYDPTRFCPKNGRIWHHGRIRDWKSCVITPEIKSLLVCATFRCRFETSEATFCEDVTFDVIALPRSILGRRTDKEIKEGEGQKKFSPVTSPALNPFDQQRIHLSPEENETYVICSKTTFVDLIFSPTPYVTFSER